MPIQLFSNFDYYDTTGHLLCEYWFIKKNGLHKITKDKYKIPSLLGFYSKAFWGKYYIRAVSAPCVLLFSGKASYSLNFYRHNTGHQRLQTHANTHIGEYIL